jgi:hypothetical protein
MSETLTAWDFESALHSQGACNLSGLARSLRQLPGKFTASNVHKDNWRKHCIVRLYVAQMVWLAYGKQESPGIEADEPLPDDLSELIDLLNAAVDQGWNEARERNKGTEFVNTYPQVQKVVRKLCNICHKGTDPFGWRWQMAYHRAHVYAGKHPYSQTEKLTAEEAASLLAQYDREEQLREVEK